MAAGRGGVRSNDRLQRAGGTDSFPAPLRTANTCWDGEPIQCVDELVSHLLRLVASLLVVPCIFGTLTRLGFSCCLKTASSSLGTASRR